MTETDAQASEEASVPEILYDAAAAKTKKEEGNQYFTQSEFDLAIECYDNALSLTPPDATRDLAILHGNKGVCLLKLERLDLAIESCTKSVEFDETYVKSYIRRAGAYEKKEQYAEALKDVNKILELEPGRPDMVKWAAELDKKQKEKFEKDKDEMIGKLKDLGNTLLGKFGLSVDNFKLNKDPNSGGYNISFGQ
eukprot:GILJ01003247.1.p1 GENE.GILJ01003247.1~~GILJ01003247.1.p1  ORF type:complete len:224 (+),score=37.99 GILJ01003247.1:90-674(+)